MKTNRTKLPEEIILFVTSRCNLRCKHCFNWKNLGRKKDLSLQEIGTLAKSLPTLKRLSLSGGEPFIREDLLEICNLFIKHCRLDLLEIPTAGYFTDKIISTVGEILNSRFPGQLSISISLDGLAEYHDSNRGVPGLFVKAVECCSRLLELKKQNRNLAVNILTTVTRENLDELMALSDFVSRDLPTIDNLYWGVLRGDLKGDSLLIPTAEQMERIDEKFIDLHVSKKRASEISFEKELYKLRREVLLKKELPIPCVAGTSIAVVYDDGSVAPCELLPSVGNIRDASFEDIWNGDTMEKMRRKIKNKECSCTHECFLCPSYKEFLYNDPLMLFNVSGIRGIANMVVEKYKLEFLVKYLRSIIK